MNIYFEHFLKYFTPRQAKKPPRYKRLLSVKQENIIKDQKSKRRGIKMTGDNDCHFI